MEAIKEAMTQYWGCRAEKFSDLRRREFAGEKHRQWAAELDRYIPSGRKLRILDIGTGTGFFAFLLAERGHAVTAIDLTPEMIAEAERMGKRLGLAVDFRVMDAEHPDFPPHSFDAIVTRKLTWTLPDLPGAYRTWRSLLKPGGILVNFDADYCREKPAVLPPHHAHQDVGADLLREYERMKSVLRPCQQPRPLWDTELLVRQDFRILRWIRASGSGFTGKPMNFTTPHRDLLCRPGDKGKRETEAGRAGKREGGCDEKVRFSPSFAADSHSADYHLPVLCDDAPGRE